MGLESPTTFRRKLVGKREMWHGQEFVPTTVADFLRRLREKENSKVRLVLNKLKVKKWPLRFCIFCDLESD